MKFTYQYRTSDNKSHNGVVLASSKEAAYAALKARGIKPGRVDESPGVFNKLFGKGKRWIAIAVLSAIVIVGAVFFLLSPTQIPATFEERGQLYADASVMQAHEADAWAGVFDDIGDRFLAAYAQPGKRPDHRVVSARPKTISTTYVLVAATDAYEVARMKRMVNGMKRELKRYLASGGCVEGYMDRLEERQNVEARIVENITREIEAIRRKATALDEKDPLMVLWREKNKMLREMGFKTIPLPEEWEWSPENDHCPNG